MTTLMSFVVTFVNIGYNEFFFNQWFEAFVKSYIVAFPTVLIVVPLVRKTVKGLLAKDDL